MSLRLSLSNSDAFEDDKNLLVRWRNSVWHGANPMVQRKYPVGFELFQMKDVHFSIVKINLLHQTWICNPFLSSYSTWRRFTIVNELGHLGLHAASTLWTLICLTKHFPAFQNWGFRRLCSCKPLPTAITNEAMVFWDIENSCKGGKLVPRSWSGGILVHLSEDSTNSQRSTRKENLNPRVLFHLRSTMQRLSLFIFCMWKCKIHMSCCGQKEELTLVTPLHLAELQTIPNYLVVVTYKAAYWAPPTIARERCPKNGDWGLL